MQHHNDIIISDVETMTFAAEALQKLDRRFLKLHEANGLPPLRRRPGGLSGLAHIITGQLISSQAARRIWERVGPVICGSSVEELANMEVDVISQLGLTRAKATAIVEASRQVHRGSFSFAALETLDDEAAAGELMKLTGVGQWTADIYLLTCLGRGDAWPAGDLAVRHGVCRLAHLGKLPDRQEMLEVAKKWRPLRAVAARYLWDDYARNGKSELLGQAI